MDEAARAGVARASSSIARVPSTLISRASSSGRSNVIDAAQWQTTSIGSSGARTPDVRSPCSACTRSRYGEGSR